jgi:hypothetical protein
VLHPARIELPTHAIRGQRLGARLLAHALQVLGRSSSDVTILEAAPTWSIYDPPAPGECRPDLPEQPPESIAALVRYYERVGFRRWFTDIDVVCPFGSIMWHPGWAALPFNRA